MASIFGHLGLGDTERVFATAAGKQVIWEAAQQYVAAVNEEMDKALSVLVEKATEKYSLRYMLPGGGYLQRRSADGTFGSVKQYGKWDVGFPLEDFGAVVAANDVSMAYMSALELDTHIQGVVAQNVNTVRFEVLRALFNNVQGTFTDPIHGSITTEPLANGDTVLYPPIAGASVDATEDHYLGSAYAQASISDANDPIVTLVAELTEHFGGTSQTGDEIVVMVNPAAVPYLKVLTGYAQVADRFIKYGDDTDLAQSMPVVPGRIVGRHAGAWINEWAWIPSGWMLATHMGHPAPLMKRVDPADTGLGQGFQLVALDERFPWTEAVFRHRFGIAAGNRLNGVVIDLSNTDSDYDIPAAYA